MVDILLVPEWFKDTVGEAECQDVLYCLFAHVVNDTVYLVLTEDAGQFAIEFLGRGQITSKGLFDHDACTALLVVVDMRWAGQPGGTELMDDFSVGGGGHSQVDM